MKRLKIHIVKLSTFVIGMFYMLMPIHKEIKSVLHSISHSIEMSGFMQHHNHSQNGHLKNAISELNIPEHDHKIISLLDYLIDAEDHRKESKKSNTKNLEIDKHFHLSKYLAIQRVLVKNALVNDNYKENIEDGFYSKIKIPPKKNLKYS